MVQEKIVSSTPDAICYECGQCFEEVCRAFQVPHSKHEAAYRSLDTRLKCDRRVQRQVVPALKKGMK